MNVKFQITVAFNTIFTEITESIHREVFSNDGDIGFHIGFANHFVYAWCSFWTSHVMVF